MAEEYTPIGSGLDDDTSYNSDTTKQWLDWFDAEFPEPVDPIRRDEIGGLEHVIERLDAFRRATEYPKFYKIYGVRPPRGFIMTGPPGCGKTYMARFLAKSLNARFAELPLTKFESKYVGESEKTLANKIHSCRQYFAITETPVLLFFDEAEEAFKDRRLFGWHGPRVNTLLREMDGLTQTNEGIYFGAATNYIERVDPAIMRPGRLDYHIEIGDYDATALADVFRAIAARLNRKAKIKKFKPFQLTPGDCKSLGYTACSLNFSPAAVNDVFNRATDAKIKELCDGDDGSKVIKENLIISYPEIRLALETYDVKKAVSRNIGFVEAD